VGFGEGALVAGAGVVVGRGVGGAVLNEMALFQDSEKSQVVQAPVLANPAEDPLTPFLPPEVAFLPFFPPFVSPEVPPTPCFASLPPFTSLPPPTAASLPALLFLLLLSIASTSSVKTMERVVGPTGSVFPVTDTPSKVVPVKLQVEHGRPPSGTVLPDFRPLNCFCPWSNPLLWTCACACAWAYVVVVTVLLVASLATIKTKTVALD